MNLGHKLRTTVRALFLMCSIVLCGVNDSAAGPDEFADYWYSGKAELSRYELHQARYGEVHSGDAVLIFVTEDFLTDKQVKYDSGTRDNVASVLKLNLTRKFNTGIYPYSMMSSIFTTISDKASTLKVTTTSQDWCGHTFMQLNNRNGNFETQLRSYFQSESDVNSSIDNAMLEDEIWTRIRLAPRELPTGNIELIPGTQIVRLRHLPLKVERAMAELSTSHEGSNTSPRTLIYTVTYKDLHRTLAIEFEESFPHRIVGWTESNPSGFGAHAKVLTTSATRTHSIKSDYWARHSVSDLPLRDELGLRR